MATLTADGRQSLNVVIAFLVLGVVAVFLRFGIRVKTRSKIMDSDYCLTGSMIALAGFSAVLFRVLSIAGTLNASIMTLPQLMTCTKYFYAAQFLLCFCISLAKIGLLLFYRDIFVHRPFRRMVYGGVALIVAWSGACVFVVAFQCRPIKAAYDITVQAAGNAKCLEFGSLVLGAEITNIITDVFLIVLPINEVRKLHMKPARKIAVSFIFAFGIFVTAISIVRIVVSLDYDGSGTADLPKVMTWSMVEMSCSLICACIPGLAPLMPSRLPTVFISLASASKSWISTSSRQKSQPDQSSEPDHSGLPNHSDISIEMLMPKPPLPIHAYKTQSTASHHPAPDKELRSGDIHVNKEVSVERGTVH